MPKLDRIDCPICRCQMTRSSARKSSVAADLFTALLICMVGFCLIPLLIGIPIFLYGLTYHTKHKAWLCEGCGHSIPIKR